MSDTFTFAELRISLTAFAMWLTSAEHILFIPGDATPVELVDQFIAFSSTGEDYTP